MSREPVNTGRRHLAFLHTAESHVERFDHVLSELAPDVPARHVVRADLLARAIEEGGVGVGLADEVGATLQALAKGGAAVVACTCSTLGPAAEAAGARLGVSVVRIDRPMAEDAVRRGERLLIVTCLESAVAPALDLIREAAADAGRSPAIRSLCLPHAWPLFLAGDRDGYVAAVVDGLRDVVREGQVVVLAQASMADAEAACVERGIPVLTSPRPAVAAAIGLMRAERRG